MDSESGSISAVTDQEIESVNDIRPKIPGVLTSSQSMIPLALYYRDRQDQKQQADRKSGFGHIFEHKEYMNGTYLVRLQRP